MVRDFEQALCDYTGAKYAVTVNSCSMALTLAVAWHFWKDVPEGHTALLGTRCVEIPKRTYVSVPQAIIHAGGRPTFRDEEWVGMYRLNPLPVWDSARFFSSNMYDGWALNNRGMASVRDASGQMLCVSFHAAKILGDTQGGAILHDNPEADAWLRRARFDGRTEGVAPKDDKFTQIGWHAYLSPDVAARLLFKLSVLPKHNAPLPNDDYPELDKFEIFQ